MRMGIVQLVSVQRVHTTDTHRSAPSVVEVSQTKWMLPVVLGKV
jgi:hypothetical protein